ncbi:hypothetical protein SAMN05216428_12513, partial [Nitrosospira sp. Nsp11]
DNLETFWRQAKLAQARQQGVDVVGLVERGDHHRKLYDAGYNCVGQARLC